MIQKLKIKCYSNMWRKILLYYFCNLPNIASRTNKLIAAAGMTFKYVAERP